MEKVITIELKHDGSTLYCPVDNKTDKEDVKTAIQNVFGTLEYELEHAVEQMTDDEPDFVFKVVVRKIRTRKFIDNLSEFEGF